MKDKLKQTYLHLPLDLQPFIITVHDWLALLTDQHYEWGQYESNLSRTIDDHTKTLPTIEQTWLINVKTTTDVAHRLIYRQYLLKDILAQDIIVQKNHWPLYALMASTMVDAGNISPLIPLNLWEKIDHDPHPINILRQRQYLCRMYLDKMGKDYPSDPVSDEQHHGIMTSFSILYGLYLIYVILRHERDVSDNETLRVIVDVVLDTVSQLKGVLCHGETYWQ